MMKNARRWIICGPGEAILESFDYDETALKPTEMAVRVQQTAISPGTEGAVYQGLEPDASKPGRWCSYPWHPGYAGVGEVLAVGSDVTGFRAGDRVVGPFRHASHATIDTARQTVVALHPGLKPGHAAYTPLFAIAMTALEVIRATPFSTAGVWGQGAIGNMAAQVLRCAGFRVVGMDPVERRRELSLQCGIREAWDPGSPSLEEQVREFTGGDGFDVTVDVTGHAPTTARLPLFTRRRGQMVFLTHWRKQPVIDMSDFLYTIFVKGISFHGAHASVSFGDPFVDGRARERAKWVRLQDQMALGALTVEPFLSHVIKPGQAREAYEGLGRDPASWTGVVVDWCE